MAWWNEFKGRCNTAEPRKSSKASELRSTGYDV